jgi:hypothetical protein
MASATRSTTSNRYINIMHSLASPHMLRPCVLADVLGYCASASNCCLLPQIHGAKITAALGGYVDLVLFLDNEAELLPPEEDFEEDGGRRRGGKRDVDVKGFIDGMGGGSRNEL